MRAFPSHPSRSARVSHYSPVSPVSPQMWMIGVDNGVDNDRFTVRSGSLVRLSPCVDPLWIPTARRGSIHAYPCVGKPATCGDAGSSRLPSPDPHNPVSHRPQQLPRLKVAPSARRGSPSTLSPSPTTTTREIHSLFTHRLRAAGGGYLPYCLSPTGQCAWQTPSGGRP